MCLWEPYRFLVGNILLKAFKNPDFAVEGKPTMLMGWYCTLGKERELLIDGYMATY